ncbi:NAD-binding protein [Dendrothele bispora CBS 962.96]|uniref:NAD-binding protein n=1 Tax=Dendrothele bispora (strain CBS 962.96) TaxID=1314807 RepID=A0A4S8M3J5_DENBC|nr:NAD-binding protein [Dendrothele bispora CBS 962.96]
MSRIPDEDLLKYSNRAKGKVVLITGAANGIGKEAATRFAEAGARVIIGDLNVSGAEKTAGELQAIAGKGTSFARKCDVTNWEDLIGLYDFAIEKFGSVDIVVANAGVSEVGRFIQVDLDSRGKPVKPNLTTVNVNLVGAMYTAHLAQHYLCINREPEGTSLKAIVMIGSMASWLGIPPAPVYTAAKHGVLGVVRSLDPVLAQKNIRINAICPFFADTGIVPIPAKLFLAGIPLVPVPRIASVIFYSATNPDPETSGRAFCLLDDGPAFQVPKEEFKLGVYGMIDQRANALLRGAKGIAHYTRVLKDVVHVLKTPIIWTVLAGGAAAGWTYREPLLQQIQSLS